MSNKDNELVASATRGINIGYGNFVSPSRVVAILESGSLPMKRLRERSQQAGLLLDATAGRKTRSLIVLDSRHVILSALAPQTLNERILDTAHRSMSPGILEMQGGELVS
jgi:extracellular matrix regulatory protein A